MSIFRDFIGWATGESKREFAGRMDALEQQIFNLPLSDAKTRAEALLATPDSYGRSAPAEARLELSPDLELPSSALDFFTRYESLEELDGAARLSRRMIGRSATDPRYVRIGTEIDDAEIVVSPRSDTVYVIDSTEPTDSPEEQYPSIYHYILFKAALLEQSR